LADSYFVWPTLRFQMPTEWSAAEAAFVSSIVAPAINAMTDFLFPTLFSPVAAG
jgi:hypothetical protein